MLICDLTSQASFLYFTPMLLGYFSIWLITSLLKQRSQNEIQSHNEEHCQGNIIQFILIVLNCLLGHTNGVEYVKDINKKKNKWKSWLWRQTDRQDRGERSTQGKKDSSSKTEERAEAQTDNDRWAGDILYSTQRGGREEGGGRHKWGENKENMILKPNQENKEKTMAQSGLEVSHTGA